jgi:ribose 5-phosphate isomerase B
MSRQHNDSNMLALGSRVVGEDLAKMIVKTWLDTEYQAGRHQRRLDLIKRIEDSQMLDVES